MGKEVSVCVNSSVCSRYDILQDKFVDSGIYIIMKPPEWVLNLFTKSVNGVNAEAAGMHRSL